MTRKSFVQLIACALVAFTVAGCGTVDAIRSMSPEARQRAIRHSCERLDPQDRGAWDGCSDGRRNGPPQRINPPQPPAQQVASPGSPMATTVSFPTTTAVARGTPWMHQHENGYTGSLEKAAKLCKLTPDETAYFEKEMSDGNYIEVEVPDGAVLDCLTFSRVLKGKVQHLAQAGVEVAFNRGSVRSRLVRLVRLPNSDRYFGKFDGCGNYGLATGQMPVVAGPCKPQYRVAIWDPNSVQSDSEDPTLREAVMGIRGRGYIDAALSRSLGDRLRAAQKRGHAALTRCTFTADFSLWEPADPFNRKSNAMKGIHGHVHKISIVGGDYLLSANIEPKWLEAYAIRIDFPNDFMSPSQGEDTKRGVIAWRWEPRDCVVWIHAIAPEHGCQIVS